MIDTKKTYKDIGEVWYKSSTKAKTLNITIKPFETVKVELFKNSISRNLTLFSLAIACAVCLLSLEYIIGSKEGYYFFDSIRESIFNSAGCQLSHFFDFEFLLSGFIFFLFSLIWHLPYIYKRLKAK